MSYTHCKGCGMALGRAVYEDTLDGLCSAMSRVTLRSPDAGVFSCYARWLSWSSQQPDDTAWGFESPQHAVRIDQWLEKGMP